MGLITYMRTDSLRISEEAIAAAKTFILGRYGQSYYPKTARHYKAKAGAQDAHEAIRPSNVNLTPEQIKAQGFDTYFVDHTTGVYPVAASGTPFSAATFSVTGDTLADLNEDLAAEQKARMTYDNILRFADDPDVRDPIKFLRAREVVHYQRFGEGLRLVEEALDPRDPYARNPAFDA